MTGPLWTVARIAEHLGVPRHRVEYLIRSRRVAPIGRAGIARVFGPDAVDALRGELRAIDARREGVSRAQ